MNTTPKTIKFYDAEYPVLQELGDGWCLIAHPNGPAISTDKFSFLGTLARPIGEVPEAIRTAAIEALMDLSWKWREEATAKKTIAIGSALLSKHGVGCVSTTMTLSWRAGVTDADKMRGMTFDAAVKCKPGFSVDEVLVDIVEL
jgi:hypothetical protein